MISGGSADRAIPHESRLAYCSDCKILREVTDVDYSLQCTRCLKGSTSVRNNEDKNLEGGSRSEEEKGIVRPDTFSMDQEDERIQLDIATVKMDNEMFVIENVIKAPALLDSGAAVSIVPNKLWKSHGSGNLNKENEIRSLKGVTGNPISIMGSCTVPLDLGFSRMLEQEIIVVDLDLPYLIVGADCMLKHGIILSPQEHKAFLVNDYDSTNLHSFTDAVTTLEEEEVLSYGGGNAEIMVNKIGVLDSERGEEERRGDAACRMLLKAFPSLTSSPDYKKPPRHNFKLDIQLSDDRPILQRPRRFSPKDQEIIKDHFTDLTNRGAAIRGSSEYVAPIVLVPKKNNKVRVCIDYTLLNKHTIPLNYPIPLIQDLTHKIPPKTNFFSVLDLSEAYYQLPLTEEASRKAAIICNDGVFRPLRTQFGLKNAPARFCEMMASMIRGLENFIFFYLDDFLIFSASVEEHIQHVELLLQRLEKYGMFLHEEKCHFCLSEVNFLGYRVSGKGLLPMKDNVEAIRKLSAPTNLQEVRRVIGTINYYRNFIPKVSELLAPLNNLLKGDRRPKKRKITWTEEHQTALDQVKEALVTATHLSCDDASRRLVLTTDGSGKHCGAVLEVEGTNNEPAKPLAFFSKPFTEKTSCRSAFHRELCGLFLAVKHFKNVLKGREILIRTDHRALLGAIRKGSGEHSILEQNRIAYIKEFQPEIIHIPGKENEFADMLSRPNPTMVCSVSIENWNLPPMEEFGLYQMEDPGFQEEMERLRKVEGILVDSQDFAGTEVVGVIFTEDNSRKFRPLVPSQLRSAVFHLFHDTIHQGRKKSVEIIQDHFFWYNMKEDIEEFCTFCPQCQTSKVLRKNKSKVGKFSILPGRFRCLHLDLTGPLQPHSSRYSYIFVIRDRATGFVRLIPLRNKSSERIVSVMKKDWFSIFGLPDLVITDNGGEFNSEVFEECCSMFNIKHKRTTPYHPQSNGFAERVNRILKTALRAMTNKEYWADLLPYITLFFNNQVSGSNEHTPHQMAFGSVGRIPGTLPIENPATHISTREMEMFMEAMTQFRHQFRSPDSTSYIDKNLWTTNFVWIKREGILPALAALYEGPYKVERRYDKYFEVSSHKGVQKVSIDRLKTAYIKSDADEDDEASIVEDMSPDQEEKTNTLRRSQRTSKPPSRMNL